MRTAEKIKSLLKKITSPTVESEYSQISNNPELLFVVDYSQFENVHFLTAGEIIFLVSQKNSLTFVISLVMIELILI